jgi:hypothetical protein
MKQNWKNLALSTFLALASYGADAQAAETKIKHIPQGTRIEQTFDGKPIVIAQAVSSTAYDDTARPSFLKAESQTKTTVADGLSQNPTVVIKAKTIDEHCTTCPKPLGPLQPATITRYDADGTVLQSTLQKLNAKEKCDRITKGLEDCVFPGQSIVASQPLTTYQREFFRFVVQPEKGLSKEQTKAVRDVWRDGKATYDELERFADVLPRGTDGKPYAAATLFSQVRHGAEECSYGMKVRAVKCEKELPPVIIPPPEAPKVELPAPAPVTPPAPFCGDNMVNLPNEQCDGTDTPAGRECTSDCTLVPEKKVEVLPENRWHIGLGYGKTLADMSTTRQTNQICIPCDKQVTNNVFENTKATGEIGYEKGNFAATLSAEQEKGRDKQEDFGNWGGLKRFYATGRNQNTVGVDATWLANNGPARVGLEAGAEVTRTELSDVNPFTEAKSTSQVSTHLEKAGIVVATGQLDESYAKVSGGFKKGTIAPGIIAPSAQDLPAFSNMTSTLNLSAPYAGAEARLRVFNHFEVKGSGEYTFVKEDSPIKKMWEGKIGAMYWTSTSTLHKGLGLGFSYGREVMNIGFPGNSSQTIDIKNDKPPVMFEIQYRFNMPWQK